MTENVIEKKSPEINLQRIYMKDISFEAPRTPDVFKDTWTPQMTLEVHITTSALQEEDTHEVVLDLNIHVKNQESAAFLIDVKQAGIFTVKHVEKDQLEYILRSYCPQILYPYAREAVSDLASRGSFPQLLLAPIHFDALYMKEKADKAKGEKETIQ